MFEDILFNGLCIAFPLLVILLMATRGDHNYIFQFIAIIASVGLAVYFLFFSSGCKQKPQIEGDYKKQAEVKFTKAMKQVKQGSCTTATNLFEEVVELYPYSDIAKKSSVMQIYCDFILKNYESAISLADIHQKFYPYDEQNSYVAYIKALSYFNTIKGFKRNTKTLENTGLAISYIKNNFSNTKYPKLLSDYGLQVEKFKYQSSFDIATYYYNKNNILASFKRLQDIKQIYSGYDFYNSSEVEKLQKLCLQKMKLDEESNKN